MFQPAFCDVISSKECKDKNVFKDTYEGLAKWINNQLTKK